MMEIGAFFVRFFGHVGLLNTLRCASFRACGAPGDKRAVRGDEAGCREVAKAGCCVLARAGCHVRRGRMSPQNEAGCLDERGRMSPQSEAGCRCTPFCTT